MSKSTLFIMSLCASLCSMGIYAQETTQRIISINEMFSLADQNSKSLRPFATDINEATESIKVAKSARLPDISASLSFSYLGDGCIIDRDFSSGTNATMPHFGNNFAIEASQAIYTGGAIDGSIAIAKLQRENAILNHKTNQDKIRFLLVGQYLDLFKQKNLYIVYSKNIEQTKQVLKDMHSKELEGVILKNDITRYELMLSNLEFSRIQIENTISILNNNLAAFLGIDDGVLIEPDTTLLEQTLSMEHESNWNETALTNSPTLKQLTLAVEINKQQNKIIKSERIPDIALFAGNHFDGPITIEVPTINKNFNYWYVGIGLKYNLSSLYKTNKSVLRSHFTVKRTQEQLDDAQEQTELAIKEGYIKYMEAYVERNTQQKSVELANQNYDVIHNRYKNDMALITDMLDASNSKLTAELQLVNARINIIFNYYKLLYISGIL